MGLGRWDKKEKEMDSKKKQFVDRGDGKKPSKSTDELSFDLIDKIKQLAGKSDGSKGKIKYFRVFYIRMIDNKIDDILVEQYEDNESVLLGLLMNSDGKMQKRVTDNGVIMFEWENTNSNGQKITYTAISYSIREGE